MDSGNNSLRAISLDLVYNETALEVNDIDPGDIFDYYLIEPGSGDFDGHIHYGMAKTDNFTPASGTFITIEFHVKDGAADGDYLLDLKNVTLNDENKDLFP